MATVQSKAKTTGTGVTDTRPKKPRPDFPLFPHGSGNGPGKTAYRWAKKVRGKLHYFGKVADDPKGERALLAWLDQKDALLAGRTPRPSGGITVQDVCNHFLTFKESLRDNGELAPRTFDRYKATAVFVADEFGRTRLVDDLAADDFIELRATMAKRWGLVSLGNEVQTVRSIFRYGFDAGLYGQPVRFGPGFKKPKSIPLYC